VAITKVIAENKILTENHLISMIDLFRLNPKVDIKTSKRRWSPLFLICDRCTRAGRRRGP
jgi:hypothetical protein